MSLAAALLASTAPLLAVSTVPAQHPPAPTDPVPELAGVWRNEAGSELVIEVDARRVSGRFRNAAGDARARDGYPVRGWLNGDLLAFCVDWGSPGNDEAKALDSVSCWVGQHTRDDEGEAIRTQWLIERNVADPDEAEKLWGAVLTGADLFRKRPATVSAPGARPPT